VKGYYFCTGWGLVAIIAGDGHMAASEWKAGLLVLVEREAGGFESGGVVALLAAIAPRSSCELAFVLILMAIDALREFDFEFCFFAGRRVTRSAFDGRVREREGESCFGVIGD